MSLIGAVACSSTAERTVDTAATAAVDSSVAGATTTLSAPLDPSVTTVPGVDTTVPAPPVDGAAVLAQAVAGLAGGYHFTTTVSVNGAETLVADGDRIADSSRLSLFSKGGSVAYVITPAGSWAFPENGEWEALDSPPATADPIIALQAPLAVTVSTSDGTTTSMVVSVAAAALGIAAEGNSDVQVTVSGGLLQQVSYSAALADGTTASVVALIGPLVDTSPIVAPI